MMLLQDALTGAQPEAGERLVFVSSGILGSSILSSRMVPSSTRGQAFGEGVRDGDDGYGLLAFRGNGQSAAAARMHRMQRVIDDLHADLEQLVGIPANEQQFWRKLSAHFNLETLPLRLRKFDGSAQQGIEIYGSHRGRALFGKTEQAGDQRSGAAGMLSDPRRQLMLFRGESCRQQEIGIAQHGGDGVVQFVGGARYQLSDRS